MGPSRFHLCSMEDLKEYYGIQDIARSGQAELRDKWNEWNGTVDGYYRDAIGDSYLFDLAAWHSSGDADGWGNVIELGILGPEIFDFGGGIGTYSLIAASNPDVRTVWFYDINDSNVRFSMSRFEKYGLADKILLGIPSHAVNSVMAIDVLEHMEDRMGAIQSWLDLLVEGGRLFLTYTANTSNGQHPMHLMVEQECKAVIEYLSDRCERIGTSYPQIWQKRPAV